MRLVRLGPSFFGFHIVHPHSSTYIVHPHKKRIPLKPVNRFIFVCFRRCKNSSPVLPLAYKSTAAVAFGLQKVQTATALSTHCYSSRGAVVSVVSAFRVHFLTFIDNYPIFQRASSYALNSFGRTIRGACFRRFSLRFGGKVTRL